MHEDGELDGSAARGARSTRGDFRSQYEASWANCAHQNIVLVWVKRELDNDAAGATTLSGSATRRTRTTLFIHGDVRIDLVGEGIHKCAKDL